MSRIKRKFVLTGNGSEAVNAQVIHSTYTPSNYTPVAVGSESTDQTSAHLKGIDTAIGSIGGTPGDIAEQSFTALNNQPTDQNVTGLAFNNANIRSFEAIISVSRASTYEAMHITGIQKAASWDIIINKLGDATGVSFDINSSGQITYTSTNTGSNATVRFRALVTRI